MSVFSDVSVNTESESVKLDRIKETTKSGIT